MSALPFHVHVPVLEDKDRGRAPEQKQGRVFQRVVLFLLLAAACGPRLQITGESVKRRADERPPRNSALFDGHTLRLRGARGETLGVQVMAPGYRGQPVVLSVPAAVGQVAAFNVRWLTVREGSTSLYGPSRGTGAYPDPLIPVAQGQVATASDEAFFDVAIAKTARPGDYEGEVRVGREKFAVALRVEPITIDLAADPLVWVFYVPKEIARVHGTPDDDGAMELTWERRYHDLFRAHGAYLASDLPPSRFAARRAFVQGVRYWPVGIDIASDEHIVRDVQLWLGLFQGMTAQPFVIPVDEPKTVVEQRRVRHFGELIAAAAAARQPPSEVKLLRAVTAPVAPEFDGAIDVYISPYNIPEPARSRQRQGERFWTYNGRPPQAGSLILDTDGAALRTWGWLAYRYGIELWYAWEGLYFSDRYNGGSPTDIMRDPLTFDERRKGGEDFGNGDGVLAYPGPAPSLRLKALRRGLQDRLLLRRLAACGGGAQADAIAARIAPRGLGEAVGAGGPSWPTDERAWEAARAELLDALAKRCPDGA